MICSPRGRESVHSWTYLFTQASIIDIGATPGLLPKASTSIDHAINVEGFDQTFIYSDQTIDDVVPNHTMYMRV